MANSPSIVVNNLRHPGSIPEFRRPTRPGRGEHHRPSVTPRMPTYLGRVGSIIRRSRSYPGPQGQHNPATAIIPRPNSQHNPTIAYPHVRRNNPPIHQVRACRAPMGLHSPMNAIIPRRTASINKGERKHGDHDGENKETKQRRNMWLNTSLGPPRR